MSWGSTVGSVGWLVYLTVGVILGSLAFGVWSIRDPDNAESYMTVVRIVALAAFAVLWLPIVLYAAGAAGWRRLR
jgi:dolichyl-phosphate-mannose--protein O-mannosyl transferase